MGHRYKMPSKILWNNKNTTRTHFRPKISPKLIINHHLYYININKNGTTNHLTYNNKIYHKQNR